MKGRMFNSRLMGSVVLCLGLALVRAGVASAQPTGSIVGWGVRVVVEPSALNDLVAVAGTGGWGSSLGVKQTSLGVLRVPSNYPTRQAGIDAAAGGDTVVVAAGTYTGPGNRNLDFEGRDLVLAYEGMLAGPWNGWSPTNEAGQVIVDCEGSGRGIWFHRGETDTSLVKGLSFVDGAILGGGGGSSD